ncbi:MAG: tyrosine-type recombinase/integrase [Pseudomonadota bacterium]
MDATLGWSSEGWTEARAADERVRLIEQAAAGGPKTPRAEKTQAQRERIEQERRLRAEERKNISFKQFFDDIYRPDAETRLAPATIRSNAGHVRNWIAPITGDIPMRELGVAEVQRIRSALAKKGRSSRSQQYVLMTFQLVWNMALDLQIVDRPSPTKAKSTKPPKIDNERQRFLTEEEVALIVDCLHKRSPQAADMFLVGLDAGLRFGEIAALTWDCIDLENDTLRVLNTKSAKDRFVPMTTRLRELFRVRESGKPGQLVFPGLRFGELQEQVPSAFWRGLNDSGLNDGVSDPKMKVCFHTSRHTFGSRLAQQGVDLLHIQRLLGHSTPTLSARYAKLRNDDLKAAVARMEKSERMRKKIGKVINFNNIP